MRDLFTKDLSWKIFSLVLAVAIWLVVRPNGNEPSTLSNPLSASERLTFANLPVFVVSSAADVREFKVNPNVVQVEVSGPPKVVKELEEKDIHVTVDLSDIVAAQDLRKRVEVSMPPGVALVRVTPSFVDAVVPPKKEK